MRKTKKIISLMLCFVMILTMLTGCSFSNPGKEWLKLVSELSKIENFEFNENLQVKVPKELFEGEKDISVGLNIEGLTNLKDKEVMVSLGLDYDNFDSDLTTVIINEEAVYLDFKTLIEAVSDLAGVSKEELDVALEEYLTEVDDKEVIGIKLSDLYEGDFWEDFILNKDEITNELMKKTADYAKKTFNEIILNGDFVVADNTDFMKPSYTLTLSDDNFVEVSTVTANVILEDFETFYDIYAELAEESEAEEILDFDELKENFEDFLEGVDSLSEEELSELPEFELKVELKKEKKTYTVKTELEIEGVKIKDTTNVTAKTPAKLEIPEAYIFDAEELDIEPIKKVDSDDFMDLLSGDIDELTFGGSAFVTPSEDMGFIDETLDNEFIIEGENEIENDPYVLVYPDGSIIDLRDMETTPGVKMTLDGPNGEKIYIDENGVTFGEPVIEEIEETEDIALVDSNFDMDYAKDISGILEEVDENRFFISDFVPINTISQENLTALSNRIDTVSEGFLNESNTNLAEDNFSIYKTYQNDRNTIEAAGYCSVNNSSIYSSLDIELDLYDLEIDSATLEKQIEDYVTIVGKFGYILNENKLKEYINYCISNIESIVKNAENNFFYETFEISEDCELVVTMSEFIGTYSFNIAVEDNYYIWK